MEFVDSISETANSKGYVKGPIMYMATDDLVVTLMSSISVISLLSSVCIHVNDLEEKVVNIGINVVRRVKKKKKHHIPFMFFIFLKFVLP